MKYKRLAECDIDNFVDNRIEFVTLIRDIKDVNLFKESTREYIKENLNGDNLIIYIAVDNEKIVSSCMLCIYKTIPIPSCLNGKVGELLNVYTKENYRRQGHSQKLIKMLMEEARKKGVSKIILDYTEEGYPLYKHLGFKECNNIMEYKL